MPPRGRASGGPARGRGSRGRGRSAPVPDPTPKAAPYPAEGCVPCGDNIHRLTNFPPGHRDLWPDRLPTYEHWCQATLYDSSQDNGGTNFQRMLALMLGPQPDSMHFGETVDVSKITEATPYCTIVDGKYVRSGVQCVGLPSGKIANTNEAAVITFPFDNPQKMADKPWLDQNQFIAGSRVQYRKQTGTNGGLARHPVAGANARKQLLDNNEMSFFHGQRLKTESQLKKDNCWSEGTSQSAPLEGYAPESTGNQLDYQASGMDRMRAWFGLYWYKVNGNEPEEWVANSFYELPGKYVDDTAAVPVRKQFPGPLIRMRLPNPSYDWQESVNSLYTLGQYGVRFRACWIEVWGENVNKPQNAWTELMNPAGGNFTTRVPYAGRDRPFKTYNERNEVGGLNPQYWLGSRVRTVDPDSGKVQSHTEYTYKKQDRGHMILYSGQRLYNHLSTLDLPNISDGEFTGEGDNAKARFYGWLCPAMLLLNAGLPAEGEWDDTQWRRYQPPPAVKASVYNQVDDAYWKHFAAYPTGTTLIETIKVNGQVRHIPDMDFAKWQVSYVSGGDEGEAPVRMMDQEEAQGAEEDDERINDGLGPAGEGAMLLTINSEGGEMDLDGGKDVSREEVGKITAGTGTADLELNGDHETGKQKRWKYRDGPQGQPYGRLYTENRQNYEFADGGDLMREYEEKYMDVSNMFLGSAKPRVITRVIGSVGKPVNHFDRPLHDFPDEWEKVKAIYNLASECGMFSMAEKRRGMREGLHVVGGLDDGKCTKDGWNDAIVGFGPPPKQTQTRFAHLLFKPVFDWDTSEGLEPADPPMTVREWVQTPWHLEHLPLAPMYSTFKDGETFCNGCLRCQRPFFEHQYHYAPHKFGRARNSYPMHFEHLYFYAGACEPDFREAPRPFHDPDFWPDEEIVEMAQGVSVDPQNLGADPALAEAEGHECGNLGWPVFAFQMGYKGNELVSTIAAADMTRDEDKVKANEDALCWELNKRLRNRASKTLVLSLNEEPFTYRRYHNIMYAHRDRHADLVQGYANNDGKVKFGQRNYHLMRSRRYGNVCKDCAALLERFERYKKLYAPDKNRIEYTRSGKKKVRVVGGLDMWWVTLRGAKLSDGSWFDPWFIYCNAPKFEVREARVNKKAYLEALTDPGAVDAASPYWRHVRYWPEHPDEASLPDEVELNVKDMPDETARKLDRMSVDRALKQVWGADFDRKLQLHLEYMNRFNTEHHCSKITEGKVVSKVKAVECNVQSVWDKDSKQWEALAKNHERNASQFFEAIARWVDGQPQRNTALDRWFADCPMGPIGGAQGSFRSVRWKNQLVREIAHDFHYKVSRRQEVKQDKVRKKFDRFMFRDEVRRITDGGTFQFKYADARTVPTVDTGQLPVDKWWANKMPANPTQQDLTQRRYMEQSRLFITYALHRRISSEYEMRHVMERMADACRFVFGRDENLCKLVVFGQKLVSQRATDTISRKSYAPITKTKKEEKMERFYGDERGNSYLYDSYDTHVESAEVDVGVEIGPQIHHPHFHCILTLNHYSYVQIDTFRMRSMFEALFKGLPSGLTGAVQEGMKLVDAAGLDFYTDNENPYIHIKPWPQDDWNDVLTAYVRKSTQPSVFEALKERAR